MYLSCGKHYIELQSYESQAEMMKVLSKCEANRLILGESAELPTDFYSVMTHLGWNGRHRFCIGICSQGNGLKPHMLLQPELSQLLLGFNSEVVAVGIEDRKIHFRILLDSLFHSFMALEKQKSILIFHEIGVVALDESGQALWQYEEDVIEDFEITADHLNLKFMDAPQISLNLQSTGDHRQHRFATDRKKIHTPTLVPCLQGA